MENFITCFPGHESQHRKSMLKVLGKHKYDYFFDRWLEYFFTEADARFFASLKLNCIRIPFNYRHLEDDMNPSVLKEEGFKHLDRVIALVFHITRCRPQKQSADAENSARSTIFTLSSTCIRLPVARTRIGTQITRLAVPPSGTLRTIKIVRCGFGSRLRQDTQTINWWLATIL
jgi:hypothetical protein